MTKEEDIWCCSECGAEQGRHDIWFEGLCEKCNSSFLTPEEVIKIKIFCETLRIEVKHQNFLHKVSGGFCNVDFESCDHNSILLKVKYGTCDDGDRHVTEESYEIDRETFEIININ